MKEKWTAEQANAWYDKQGWLRGCNFIGSDCSSRIDMWQSHGRKGHMETARRELKLCQDVGFNTIRLIVEFDVWAQEHDSFMSVLEEYISLAAEHGQSVMLCLAHEAIVCREPKYTFKPLGEQVYHLGYHQGRMTTPMADRQKTPYHALELETRDAYLEMVREIVTRYANDDRILCWNVYNEPGIFLHERAVPLLDMLFETVRACDPMQPLCADIWRGNIGSPDGIPVKPEGIRALELSDLISLHSYQPIENMVVWLSNLKKLNRPILMTEWLHRINHSNVCEIYPLMYLERIGNYCWGFVLGKTQTNEPWESLWEEYARDPSVTYDFTRWQHDLFRPNLRPYDPKELEIIQKYNALADAQKPR